MARSISQIYAEAIYTRNNYLQLTELNSGRTGSKLSILNLLTYVMSVLIHTYETALDLFQLNVADIIKNRVNGTPAYYAAIAKHFQFNSETQTGDVLSFDEETYKIGYETVDESHRIIAQASWEDYSQKDAIILKVCKNNTNNTEIDGGTVYSQLSNAELTAFKQYISAIKFCGARIYCLSTPGDIVSIGTSTNAPIYYDDTLVSKQQAIQNIKDALTEYAKGFEFDGYIHYQRIIDVLQNATGIVDISSNVTVFVKLYNNETGTYDTAIDLTGRMRSSSGYLKFVNESGDSIADSLTLLPNSQRKDRESNVLDVGAVNRGNIIYRYDQVNGWSKVESASLNGRYYTQVAPINSLSLQLVSESQLL